MRRSGHQAPKKVSYTVKANVESYIVGELSADHPASKKQKAHFGL